MLYTSRKEAALTHCFARPLIGIEVDSSCCASKIRIQTDDQSVVQSHLATSNIEANEARRVWLISTMMTTTTCNHITAVLTLG